MGRDAGARCLPLPRLGGDGRPPRQAAAAPLLLPGGPDPEVRATAPLLLPDGLDPEVRVAAARVQAVAAPLLPGYPDVPLDGLLGPVDGLGGPVLGFYFFIFFLINRGGRITAFENA